MALDDLAKLDEFDPKQGMVQTAYYLNRWIAGSQEQVAWQLDPMLEELPADLRAIPPVQSLDKREFTVDDVRYLRQASWARSISKWVAQRPDDPDLAPWLKQLEKDCGEPHAYEVSLAARLFEWTVRNIQLDALLPFPGQDGGPVARPSRAGRSRSSKRRPARDTRRFPGRRCCTAKAMRGSGRAFSCCCAVSSRSTPSCSPGRSARPPRRPRPWLPAALIDDQLYLFDTGLGLPIRGPSGAGIATLAQVRQDPGILRSLDVGPELPYAAGGRRSGLNWSP